jgi:membrane dipeptidase
MDRRHFVASALAAPLVRPSAVDAQVAIAVPIGDMHFHSFFGESKFHSRPLAPMLAAGGATLVAWKAVGDLPWVDWKAYKQNKDLKPGEALGFLEREIGRIKAHCAEQKLKIALKPGDVDRAVAGEPHIVLAVEGATFIEADIAALRRAYDLGLRHIQLAHYITNPLGDIQTLPARQQGLTPLGKAVVAECNRLGILVDLAHCTPNVVRDVLAISKAPVVWSHGSVTRGPAPHPGLMIWKARQLPLETAKAIAQKGGVVGLWALTLDIGLGVDAYADRMLELAGWLGEDSVAFGTDINGLGPNAAFSTYADLRRVIERWQRQKVPETRIRKIALGNYARVLKQAMMPLPG